jgi:hypothetical protein
MQEAIEKFAIFGGVEWGEIDTSKDSFELIKELILKDYRYIRNDITELTDGIPLHHTILTAAALGDGISHSVYKRANISEDVATRAIDELVETNIIKIIKSKSKSKDFKIVFTSPFMRFWFAFVSPLFQGIKNSNFDEVEKRWKNKEQEFVANTFKELSLELVKVVLKDDGILSLSPYWDKDISIDIYAKTGSKDIIIGSSKYSNSKMKKNEFTKLQELASTQGIEVKSYILISKSGFSNELKALKGQNLKLLNIKNFKLLTESK